MKTAIRISFLLFLFISSSAQFIDLKNPSDQYDYVIITPVYFAGSFDDFIVHKERVKSLKVGVVTVNQIYSDFPNLKSKQESIREFISYAGKNWPEPKPKYFFLAGDIDAVPNYKILGVREIDTVHTDYYYSVDVDSSDISEQDYYIGRISARTTTELNNYLSKVITYESTPVEDWNNDIMMVGLDYTTGELFKQKIDELIVNLFDYLNPTTFLYPHNYTETEVRNNIINGINIEGYSSVLFWGTGNESQFGILPVLDFEKINEIRTMFYPFLNFIAAQRFSSGTSSSMLDLLLFNRNGAIAGHSPVAPHFVNMTTNYYKEYFRFLYSEYENSVASASVKAFENLDNTIQANIRKDLFGIFGDPSLSLKYDIVASNDDEELVYEYALHQNYPNPFNPTTKISFSLPESSMVELKVYNILGSEVTTLTNTQLNRGRHEFEFNAGNLSSGVYLYRLKAGSFTQTRKMLLIK